MILIYAILNIGQSQNLAGIKERGLDSIGPTKSRTWLRKSLTQGLVKQRRPCCLCSEAAAKAPFVPVAAAMSS